MILQLQGTHVIFMTQNTAILAYPFHVAVLAIVEIGHFFLLPLVGETVRVYFNWNALHLQLLACDWADLRGKGALFAIYG